MRLKYICLVYSAFVVEFIAGVLEHCCFIESPI